MAADVNASTDGGLAATHPSREEGPRPVSPATNAELNTFRLNLFPVACWRMNDIRFDFDSSFIRPEAVQEFTELAGLVGAHPGAPLAVFGHADPTGDDEYNKQLSGRRAAAVYGMLTRNTDLWDSLYEAPFHGDKWGLRSVQRMLDTLGHSPGAVTGTENSKTSQALRDFQKENGLEQTGSPGPKTRQLLYAKYMDALCGSLKLKPSDFLAQGADAHGKGDYQGCSEFNAILRFSKAQDQEFQKPAMKVERDAANSPNRRVVVYLFRPGSKVDPQKWPCPNVQAATAACRKRFWSDSSVRIAVQAEQREYQQTRDTFACRFYDRIAGSSPCESPLLRRRLQFLLDDPFLGFLAGIQVSVKYESGATETVVSDAAGYIGVYVDLGDYADLEFITELTKHSLRAFVVLPGISTPQGAWQRLVNLGYVPIPETPAEAPHDDALATAVAEFQGAHGITPTGLLDAKTQAAIGDQHESAVAWKDDPPKPLADTLAADFPAQPKDAVS